MVNDLHGIGCECKPCMFRFADGEASRHAPRYTAAEIIASLEPINLPFGGYSILGLGYQSLGPDELIVLYLRYAKDRHDT